METLFRRKDTQKNVRGKISTYWIHNFRTLQPNSIVEYAISENTLEKKYIQIKNSAKEGDECRGSIFSTDFAFVQNSLETLICRKSSAYSLTSILCVYFPCSMPKHIRRYDFHADLVESIACFLYSSRKNLPLLLCSGVLPGNIQSIFRTYYTEYFYLLHIYSIAMPWIVLYATESLPIMDSSYRTYLMRAISLWYEKYAVIVKERQSHQCSIVQLEKSRKTAFGTSK